MIGKQVLIVDDSPVIHNMLRKTLEGNGYSVCGDASNGREGVELYESLKPDLVFMDVTMPIMDGIAALKIIREKDAVAKVIMLTAMGDDEIIAQAQAAGAVSFLKKPFNDFKIISALAQIE